MEHCIYLAQINPIIGALTHNKEKILQELSRARQAHATLVLFPELALTGYPPEDLLLDPSFIQATTTLLPELAHATQGLFAAIGLPRHNPSGQEKPLFNSAALCADGQLLGFADKRLLPTYDVFDERRFFEPGAPKQPVWTYRGLRIAVTICEDCWQHTHAVRDTQYHYDPIAYIREDQPDLLLNLSASPYFYGKKQLRQSVFQAVARTLCCPVAVCNQVGAQDQLIFDGSSALFNAQGALVAQATSFQEAHLAIPLFSHPASTIDCTESIADLFQALVLGIRDYFHKQQLFTAIVGLSGGIDSALVACLASEALGAEHLSLLFLPSRFSSQASHEDARLIAHALGAAYHEFSIEPLFQELHHLLSHAWGTTPHAVTTENIQARLRSMLIMAHSNEQGSLMLNTGNKSELAMGYTTLYGDLSGGLGVLLDVTKTHVYALARYANRKQCYIPERVFQRAPSAELKENQTDQDTLPPYDLLDPILEAYLEHNLSPEEIAHRHNLSLSYVQEIIHQIHAAEYKRRQAPIGLRVTRKCFSKGRIVPIVETWRRKLLRPNLIDSTS